MTKKAKDAEVLALVDGMLRALGSLREQGDEAYPPRLRQLAALAGGSPTDGLVQAAAAKKAFTSKAVVTEKVDGKLSLDAPVYFLEDVPAKTPASKRARGPKPVLPPKPNPVRDLARRFLAVLGSQKVLGDGAYPPTLGRLAELCDRNQSDPLVTKAAGHKALTGAAVVAGKPLLDAPVVLKEDINGDLAGVLPALLRFALAPTAGVSKGKTTESTAFTPAEVKGRFVKALQGPVLEALQQGLERRDLPGDVAWVVIKGKSYLFAVGNLRPGAPRPVRSATASAPAATLAGDGGPVAPARPASDFAGAFREAFDQLDRRNGATNFVTLADLRRTLAWAGRDEFDDGLRALRLEGEFSLDSHEGLHGSLTPEDREAGVREAGSLLVYVSRR